MSAKCKIGDEPSKSMPILLIKEWICSPQDEVKDYIHACEADRIDLKACQRK